MNVSLEEDNEQDAGSYPRVRDMVRGCSPLSILNLNEVMTSEGFSLEEFSSFSASGHIDFNSRIFQHFRTQALHSAMNHVNGASLPV